MSIAFLFKKTWHPQKVENAEKVWVAEQKAKKEEAAIREVQRRLREERSVEEMKRVHDQHTERVTGQKKKVQRLDWMCVCLGDEEVIERARPSVHGGCVHGAEHSTALRRLTHSRPPLSRTRTHAIAPAHVGMKAHPLGVATKAG
jgi:hypothetical protein